MELTINTEHFIKDLEKLSTFNNPILIETMDAASVLVQNSARENHPKRSKLVRIMGMKFKTKSGLKSFASMNRAKNPDGSERYFNVSTSLTRSIKPIPATATKDNIEGGVSTNLVYAGPIEFKYPYLVPALIVTKNKVMELFQSSVNRILTKV